jgi:ABC-type transport system involved in multi-copper enzyme maturation permease subunit
MNRGIMLKAIRELLPITLMLGMVALGAEAILAYVLPTFSGQFSMQIMRVELVQNIIKAMLGTDLAEGIDLTTFGSIAWVHPVMLAIVWAHAIICCTRVPAGEVDRGTIDVLLGLPVSRWSLFASESLVSAASAVALLAFVVAGNALGTWRVRTGFQFEPARVLIVLVNLMCLYIAVGAGAWLFSALSDRRGRAIGIVFVIVVASFLLNYLAQFWEPARNLAPLGMLRYYRPLYILRDGSWPTRDLFILLSAGAILWTAAGLIFAQRDLSTL